MASADNEHLSFRIPLELRRALRRTARRQGCSMSELIRDALEIVVAPDAFEDTPERAPTPFLAADRARRRAS